MNRIKALAALQSKRYRLRRDRASRWSCFFTLPFGHVGEKHQVEIYPGVWSIRRCVICHTLATVPHWWWLDLAREE